MHVQFTQFRVKRKTLAAEARIIRLEEARALKRGRDLAPTNRGDLQAVHYALYNSLRDHRRGVVRPMARACHLAHAYLKGRPYARVEDASRLRDQSMATRGTLAVEAARQIRAFSGWDAKPKDVLHWMEGGLTLAQEAAQAGATVTADVAAAE